MEIKAISAINNIWYHFIPDWNEELRNEKEEVRNSSLPTRISAGKVWNFSFKCNICRSEIKIEKLAENFLFLPSLAIQDYTNKIFLDKIGQVLKLDLRDEIDCNNFHIYHYDFDNHCVKVIYSNCKRCSAKYFIVYRFVFGEERTAQSDFVDVNKIVQVDFNHEEFLQELEAAIRK